MNRYTVEFRTADTNCRRSYSVVGTSFSSAVSNAKKEHSEYIKEVCLSRKERKEMKSMIVTAVILEEDETINWESKETFFSFTSEQRYLIINSLNEKLSQQLEPTSMSWKEFFALEKDKDEIKKILTQIQ